MKMTRSLLMFLVLMPICCEAQVEGKIKAIVDRSLGEWDPKTSIGVMTNDVMQLCFEDLTPMHLAQLCETIRGRAPSLQAIQGVCFRFSFPQKELAAAVARVDGSRMPVGRVADRFGNFEMIRHLCIASSSLTVEYDRIHEMVRSVLPPPEMDPRLAGSGRGPEIDLFYSLLCRHPAIDLEDFRVVSDFKAVMKLRKWRYYSWSLDDYELVCRLARERPSNWKEYADLLDSNAICRVLLDRLESIDSHFLASLISELDNRRDGASTFFSHMCVDHLKWFANSTNARAIKRSASSERFGLLSWMISTLHSLPLTLSDSDVTTKLESSAIWSEQCAAVIVRCYAGTQLEKVKSLIDAISHANGGPLIGNFLAHKSIEDPETWMRSRIAIVAIAASGLQLEIANELRGDFLSRYAPVCEWYSSALEDEASVSRSGVPENNGEVVIELESNVVPREFEVCGRVLVRTSRQMGQLRASVPSPVWRKGDEEGLAIGSRIEMIGPRVWPCSVLVPVDYNLSISDRTHSLPYPLQAIRRSVGFKKTSPDLYSCRGHYVFPSSACLFDAGRISSLDVPFDGKTFTLAPAGLPKGRYRVTIKIFEWNSLVSVAQGSAEFEIK